jgi:hypothetical protein
MRVTLSRSVGISVWWRCGIRGGGFNVYMDSDQARFFSRLVPYL